MSGRLWLRSPFDRLSPRRVAFGDRVSGKRCVPLRDGLLHVDGAADAVLDVVEGGHEAVTHGLDLGGRGAGGGGGGGGGGGRGARVLGGGGGGGGGRLFPPPVFGPQP